MVNALILTALRLYNHVCVCVQIMQKEHALPLGLCPPKAGWARSNPAETHSPPQDLHHYSKSTGKWSSTCTGKQHKEINVNLKQTEVCGNVWKLCKNLKDLPYLCSQPTFRGIAEADRWQRSLSHLCPWRTWSFLPTQHKMKRWPVQKNI